MNYLLSFFYRSADPISPNATDPNLKPVQIAPGRSIPNEQPKSTGIVIDLHTLTHARSRLRHVERQSSVCQHLPGIAAELHEIFTTGERPPPARFPKPKIPLIKEDFIDSDVQYDPHVTPEEIEQVRETLKEFTPPIWPETHENL